jgi:hypothetical protein
LWGVSYSTLGSSLSNEPILGSSSFQDLTLDSSPYMQTYPCGSSAKEGWRTFCQLCDECWDRTPRSHRRTAGRQSAGKPALRGSWSRPALDRTAGPRRLCASHITHHNSHTLRGSWSPPAPDRTAGPRRLCASHITHHNSHTLRGSWSRPAPDRTTGPRRLCASHKLPSEPLYLH